MTTLLLSAFMALTGCEKEEALTNYINDSRAKIGASSLNFYVEGLPHAVKHTEWMAENNSLQHSHLSMNICSSCEFIGENVGHGSPGSSIESMHQAFMNSEGHRNNILNPRFDSVTIYVIENEYGIWITELFFDE